MVKIFFSLYYIQLVQVQLMDVLHYLNDYVHFEDRYQYLLMIVPTYENIKYLRKLISMFFFYS